MPADSIADGRGVSPAATAIVGSVGDRVTVQAGATAINLEFRDLRREAASRWAKAGWTLTEIQEHLGHTNVSQTSTYLKSGVRQIEARMRKYDAAREYLQSVAQEPDTAHQPQVQRRTVESR